VIAQTVETFEENFFDSTQIFRFFFILIIYKQLSFFRQTCNYFASLNLLGTLQLIWQINRPSDPINPVIIILTFIFCRCGDAQCFTKTTDTSCSIEYFLCFGLHIDLSLVWVTFQKLKIACLPAGYSLVIECTSDGTAHTHIFSFGFESWRCEYSLAIFAGHPPAL